MIKSINLKNYQSHKDTTIELSPGLNVLIGNSRSGKTSIMRALNGIKNNRPTGNAMVSFWDRNKKKKNAPNTEHFSSIKFVEGKEIKRIKTKDRNGYDIIDGDEVTSFNAIKTDVPAEVEEILNMTEINIQKQFDQPFMVSDSNAEVARFLNKAIKLDLIDEVLSKVENLRRITNKKHQDIITDIEKLVVELGTFDWINKAESLEQLISRKDSLISASMNKITNINNILNDIKNIKNTIDSFPKNTEKIVGLIDEVENIDHKIKISQKKEKDIFLVIQQLNQAINTQSNLLDLDTLSKYELKMCYAEKIEDDLSGKLNTFNKLTGLVAKIKSNDDSIRQEKLYSGDLEKQLPDTCPICGKEW